MDFNADASQGKPEAIDEIVFPTMAKVMETFGNPFGRPRVLDLPIDEKGPKASNERYSADPSQLAPGSNNIKYAFAKIAAANAAIQE